MPYRDAATRRPRLLMTVVTRSSFSRRPSACSIRAQMRMIWSPEMVLPFSSTAIRRSPSPSKARPMAAPVCRTALLRSPVCCEPHLSLMLKPFGSSWMTVASAPSSVKAAGATLYVAPLATSMATLSPSMVSLRGKVLFRNTTYRPRASSSRLALPIPFGGGTISGSVPPRMSSSIPASCWSESLHPFPPNTLMPLSE